MSKGVVVTDLGGVIYSFDPKFSPEGYEERFVEALQWYSQNSPKYRDVLSLYQEGDIKLALNVEKEAVIKALDNPDEAEGTLPIYINSKAVKALVNNYLKYKIVVVSTSRVLTSKRILSKAFEKASSVLILPDTPEKVVANIDIYDMSDYGSKKDPNSWKHIFTKYTDIIAIFEDSKKNLDAAVQATKELGNNPKPLEAMVEL